MDASQMRKGSGMVWCGGQERPEIERQGPAWGEFVLFPACVGSWLQGIGLHGIKSEKSVKYGIAVSIAWCGCSPRSITSAPTRAIVLSFESSSRIKYQRRYQSK